MYTEPNGTFWAYYAHRHRHLKECNYYIRAPLGYTITLHFRYIHLLTPYKECNTHTYLEVFTGVQSNSTSLGRFCGSYAPAPVYSTSNSLLVKFVRPRFSSDKDGPYFLAKYTTQKGRHNSCWWTEHLTSCQLGLEACEYLKKVIGPSRGDKTWKVWVLEIDSVMFEPRPLRIHIFSTKMADDRWSSSYLGRTKNFDSVGGREEK